MRLKVVSEISRGVYSAAVAVSSRSAPSERNGISSFLFGRIYMYKMKYHATAAIFRWRIERSATSVSDERVSLAARLYTLYMYKKKRTISFISPRSNYRYNATRIFIYLYIYIYINLYISLSLTRVHALSSSIFSRILPHALLTFDILSSSLVLPPDSQRVPKTSYTIVTKYCFSFS